MAVPEVRSMSRQHVVRVVRSFDWSNRNRLRLRWAFEGAWWFVVLEYGNGNSDPVWSLGIERCWK